VYLAGTVSGAVLASAAKFFASVSMQPGTIGTQPTEIVAMES